MRRLAALAAAVGTAAALTGGAVPAAAASTSAQHVAIVIGSGTACVSWHSGINGAQVLTAAADQVIWGTGPHAGFVVKINGVGQNPPDDTHYWSYWHDTGSGWRYSSVGANSYQPAAGTVEGWSYVDGAPEASPPPTTSYKAICGGEDPTPQPTHTTHTRTTAPPPPRKSTARTTPTTHSPMPSAVEHATTAANYAPPPPPPSTTTAPAPARRTHDPSAPRSRTSATKRPRSTPTVRATSAAPTPHLTPLAHRQTASARGGSAAPALIGIGIALVLGGGAGWTAWRRRST